MNRDERKPKTPASQARISVSTDDTMPRRGIPLSGDAVLNSGSNVLPAVVGSESVSAGVVSVDTLAVKPAMALERSEIAGDEELLVELAPLRAMESYAFPGAVIASSRVCERTCGAFLLVVLARYCKEC